MEARESKEDLKENLYQRKKKFTSGLLVFVGLCGNMEILNKRYWRETYCYVVTFKIHLLTESLSLLQPNMNGAESS